MYQLEDQFTTTGAYLTTLHEIMRGKTCSPRGLPCFEIEDFGFTVLKPTHHFILTQSDKWNKMIARYTQQEFDLYRSRTNRATDFARCAAFWAGIANPDGTVNSAYGNLLFEQASCGKSKFAKHRPLTPWEWAVSTLKEDKDTRQAVLRFSLPKHQWRGNKDQVCTMHGHFRIRDDKLNFSIVMRSNDAVRGLVYDMPWFCELQTMMLEELAQHYPELQCGTYSHFTHSMHIYERDVQRVNEMLNGDGYATE